ncbi:hypothetical protein [Halopiger djelfimassiliensis]|uniref:hypothetical protein n=1 Tax=Halopiger djelfimassiliensis TaxID=1293047 RepID=UPI000AC56356|nr:hypothetical protein [Halopiger djelfimassiliensis]
MSGLLASVKRDPARVVCPIGVFGSMLLLFNSRILLFIVGMFLTFVVAKYVS